MTPVVLFRAIAGISALFLASALTRSYPTIRGVSFEHVTNKFGSYFVFYDHAISSNSIYTVKNKLACRYKQFSSLMNLASAGPEDPGKDGVQCNVTNLELNRIKLHRMEGATTFYESNESEFFPSSANGLFYTKEDKLVRGKDGRSDCCLNDEIQRLPAAKSERDKNALMNFLQGKNLESTFVRASYYKETKMPLWEDSSPFTEPDKTRYKTRTYCYKDGHFVTTANPYFHTVRNNDAIDRSTVMMQDDGYFIVYHKHCSRECVCVHNIFPGDWDDLDPSVTLKEDDVPYITV